MTGTTIKMTSDTTTKTRQKLICLFKRIDGQQVITLTLQSICAVFVLYLAIACCLGLYGIYSGLTSNKTIYGQYEVKSQKPLPTSFLLIDTERALSSAKQDYGIETTHLPHLDFNSSVWLVSKRRVVSVKWRRDGIFTFIKCSGKPIQRKFYFAQVDKFHSNILYELF